MGRPHLIPVEKKTRIVLSVLAGGLSIAEAARREKVSEQSIGWWKAKFLEAGKTALVAGRSGPSSREEQLEAEVAELTQALGSGHIWRSRCGRSQLRAGWALRGPRGDPRRGGHVDREVLPAHLTCPSVPGAAGRPRPAPGHGAGVLGRKSARQAARELVRKHALAHPAWGHRKIWAMVRHDGHVLSETSVLRILRDEGLILPAEYQRQRRRGAERRKAAFATEPSGANQVWQLDFSEFETTRGGTWRLARCRGY